MRKNEKAILERKQKKSHFTNKIELVGFTQHCNEGVGEWGHIETNRCLFVENGLKNGVS